MPPGTYALLIELPAHRPVRFGAAGRRDLQPGVYAYVGSAQGAGGLEARLDRHGRLAGGVSEVRHWHVDYLLGAEGTRLREAVRFPRRSVECELAGGLPGTPVPGIGASDCRCGTHLVRVADVGRVDAARGRVRSAVG